MDGRDGLQFYMLFNSISVISGGQVEIMKGCVQWNPIYDLKDSQPMIGQESGPARSTGQCFNYGATIAKVCARSTG